MDPLTGWMVGIAVFVLGGVAGVVLGFRLGTEEEMRKHLQRADLVARMDCLQGGITGLSRLDDEARAKLDELAVVVAEHGDQIATKATEAQARLEGVVRRVVELEEEQLPIYDDGELRTAFDIEIKKARAFAASEAERLVEGLRKRTSEKFSLRDRKIEDLYGRVGVLIERTDALAPTQNTVKPKPRKRVA